MFFGQQSERVCVCVCIFSTLILLGRDVGEVNVVCPHGAEARKDLSERRHDVVLQVAGRELSYSLFSCGDNFLFGAAKQQCSGACCIKCYVCIRSQVRYVSGECYVSKERKRIILQKRSFLGYVS